MQLHELFTPTRIKTDLEAEDKDEVFEELTDLLVTSYRSDRRDEILEALREREAKMSTGIKRGIAIPHGRTASVDGVLGVFGISRGGIDYDALDGEPVYLVFLMVSSPDSSEEHLDALKRIAVLLENPRFIEDVMKADDPIRANELIRSYEETVGVEER